VITYKNAAGQLQFRAQFTDWNLAPAIPHTLFVFIPPEGAAKIVGAARELVPSAAALQSMSCPMATGVIGGYTYSQCGSTWYQPAYQGSQGTHVVVNPPQ
jgi:hypothetical protein